MKFLFTIAALLLMSLLAACGDPKKWNPPLPGAHEGSSVGDHARPAEESGKDKKPAAEQKPPTSTAEVPPGGQTGPQVPTSPPVAPPTGKPKS